MNIRPDYAAIAKWVPQQSNILDLGCGDGTLLKLLEEKCQASGYGVEIDDANVLACLRNNVNVIQMNLETGLAGFEAQSFDYVILSLTLQAVRHTELMLREIVRVGKQGIVTFPNFGYWNHRWQIARGRMPVSDDLPYQWFDTPNIHLCTLADFEDLCKACGIRVLERLVLSEGKPVNALPNLRGQLAVYRFEAASK
ncbi:MAG: methionine biosynthesis protein MetW [Burkholderiales bacterium]